MTLFRPRRNAVSPTTRVVTCVSPVTPLSHVCAHAHCAQVGGRMHVMRTPRNRVTHVTTRPAGETYPATRVTPYIFSRLKEEKEIKRGEAALKMCRADMQAAAFWSGPLPASIGEGRNEPEFDPDSGERIWSSGGRSVNPVNSPR
jgi:hypothetical protein